MASILLTAHSLDVGKGGPSQNIPLLALALRAQGARVGVVSAQPGSFHPGLAENEVPTFVGPAGYLGFAGFFSRVLESFAPDVVHDNGLWLPQNHAVVRLCARASIPLVISPRGMLEPWALHYRGLKKRLAWRLYQRRDVARATCVVATSPQERTNVLTLSPLACVAVIPNGWSDPPSIRRLARRLDGPRKALFFSRIHPKKGVDLLLRAWRHVQPVGWQLDIIGPGDPAYVSALKELAASLGLGSAINLLPPVFDTAEKNSVIGSADLVVLPSHSENFGSIIVEALGLGVPAITTTGTPWQEMSQRQAGWWVEPSVAGIAGALREATELNDNARAAMGLRGREWVLSEFSWDAIALKMIKVYDQVLSGKS